MNRDEMKILLAGYQDGELDAEQRELVEKMLDESAEWREELQRLNKVKEATEKVKFNDLPLEVWDGYWQNLYRRLERGLGWIFLSVGAIIIAIVGVFYVIKDFFFNPSVALLPKLGVGALAVGAVILIISVVRERLFAYNRDRYKEVQR